MYVYVVCVKISIDRVSLAVVLRYLVATGESYKNGRKTEIVDVSNPNKSCLLDDMQSHILYRYAPPICNKIKVL